LKFILNFFTYSRILLTPLIIYLIIEGNFFTAGLIFAYCSFSDIADGKIARKYNLVSNHGNYMDPFADKVLMIGTLCSLLFLDIIQLSPFIIIVGRDVLITLYRNYLISKNKPLETSKYGKLKTVFQHGMVLIILLINPSQDIINLIVNINAIYAAGTGVQYFVKNGF
jgi:CDP-diacylglycerol--glycerol-3-phosphate 3-phosphatidyltransferase|tara:strand:- start:2492 stop:2995 length:504 start_codon:yes stop_codon:yes gene_type:complete